MFEKEIEYDRQELLDFIGSKQNQSGIIWGAKEPGCIIVTSGGKHGDSAGYGDSQNKDGTWDYIGQGASGDQDEGNFANAILINEKRDVLLFTTREPSAKEQRERGNRRKRYKFEGIFNVLSYRFITPTGGKRQGDRLLAFRLVPASNIYNEGTIETSNSKSPISLLELRNKVLADVEEGKAKSISLTEYKIRSARVKKYALSRANGVCELCEKESPFITEEKRPFLEVHHINRLADDGPDLPGNVCAICPNCHREAHFGIRRFEIRDRLLTTINEKERGIL